MSETLKKRNSRKLKILPDRLVEIKDVFGEDEKENKSTNPGKRRKISKESSKLQTDKTKLKEFDNSLLSVQEAGGKLNRVGFWGKKLQDLEKNTKKNNKSELYEFSCTDESGASNKIKKRRKQKGRIQTRRHPTGPKYKKTGKKTSEVLKPAEKTHKQPMLKKETIIVRERKKSTLELRNISLSSGLHSIAFTSTPTVNKDNSVDPSKFLLLSPIIKEESEGFNGVIEDPPLKLNANGSNPFATCFNQETPRAETRLRRISCRRVLRSGKMLNK